MRLSLHVGFVIQPSARLCESYRRLLHREICLQGALTRREISTFEASRCVLSTITYCADEFPGLVYDGDCFHSRHVCELW